MKSRIKDTLLLVGSAESDRSALHDIFEATFNLLEAENAAQGILLLQQNHSCIAAVLTDIPLSEEGGLRALVEACKPGTEEEIPVICLVTPVGNGQREESAFLLGASDVVHKPYTLLSICRRVQVLIDLYAHRWHLEKLVEEQSKTILNANQTMLDALSAIIEHRSTESGNHVLRIRRFTRILLEEVARCYPEYNLKENIIEMISSASALHDIGKISIPDAILNKPGKLTSEEFEIMKTHTTLGSEIVTNLENLGDIMFLRYAYNISRYHHERWDGNGYPEGLAGDQIPICAQVVGLVDAFDALTTPRVYKNAIPYEDAISMILNGECGIFSPKVLECFKRARIELVELACHYADGYSPKSDSIRVPLPDPLHNPVPLNALQLSHLKYQTLLHHQNDTVIELDIDSKVYHVVYNPNPDFVSLFANADFDDISHRLMEEGVHPEDALTMAEMRSQIAQKLFINNQRKCSFRCRMYSPPHGRFFPYEITILRVNTDNPTQRIVLAVFHNLDGDIATPPAVVTDVMTSPAMFDLISSIVCCSNDARQTMIGGHNMLLPLTGHTPTQLEELYGNSLRNMIVPEDRALLDQLLSQLQYDSATKTMQLRVSHASGKPVWVQIKSRGYTNNDGSEYIYHALTDIHVSKTAQLEMETEQQRNNKIVEMSQGIIFDWDMQEDILHCSPKFEKRFGYSLDGIRMTEDLTVAGHFHPDDLPDIRQTAKRILAGDATEGVDARIFASDGRYYWSRIRMAATFDAAGTPTHILGIIYDINDLKYAAISMKKKAELDGLTKLMNKASAQNAIQEYLAERSGKALAAMLVMDLDNFKLVNDRFGHLYGDAVLSQIGSTLRSLFRTHDIIGRIGGDEFMILMKDVPNQELVEERCQLLVDTFREQLHRLMPNVPVSVSVGAAMVPAHGTGYAELFRHADEALYTAKRLGKCQSHLYNPEDALHNLPGDTFEITRIDSEESSAMSEEFMVRFVFRKLYESRDIDATINELLAYIGAQFNVSRVYIFENNDDNTECSNTFEWCNEGIEPQIEYLQNLSYLTELQGWPDVYGESGVLYCADISELAPHIRAIVEPQGIKSMLHCAIMDRGVFRGYIGFDECTANYLWTKGQISMLEFMAEVMAVFLIKHRADHRFSSAPAQRPAVNLRPGDEA